MEIRLVLDQPFFILLYPSITYSTFIDPSVLIDLHTGVVGHLMDVDLLGACHQKYIDDCCELVHSVNDSPNYSPSRLIEIPRCVVNILLTPSLLGDDVLFGLCILRYIILLLYNFSIELDIPSLPNDSPSLMSLSRDIYDNFSLDKPNATQGNPDHNIGGDNDPDGTPLSQLVHHFVHQVNHNNVNNNPERNNNAVEPAVAVAQPNAHNVDAGVDAQPILNNPPNNHDNLGNYIQDSKFDLLIRKEIYMHQLLPGLSTTTLFPSIIDTASVPSSTTTTSITTTALPINDDNDPESSSSNDSDDHLPIPTPDSTMPGVTDTSTPRLQPYQCGLCELDFSDLMTRFEMIYTSYHDQLWFSCPNQFILNCELIEIKNCRRNRKNQPANPEQVQPLGQQQLKENEDGTKISRGIILCLNCLQNHITSCYQDDRGYLCPCGCDADLTEGEIYFSIERPSLIKSIEEKRLKSAIRDLVHCPTPQCDYFIIDPDATTIQAQNAAKGNNNNNNNNDPQRRPYLFSCPKCHYTTCITCNQRSVQENAQDDNNPQDNTANVQRNIRAFISAHKCPIQPEIAEAETQQELRKFKRCPVCNIPFERVGGCDHMTCRCGGKFSNDAATTS